MAGFALALRWLSWPQAAACALAAFAFNLLVLPRLLGHRLASERRGAADTGVLLYPLVVLALILLFNRPAPVGLAFAAFGWGLLAGGDALAGMAGMLWGRSPLPWNRSKTWEGVGGYVLGGGLVGWLLFRWTLGGAPPAAAPWELAALVMLATVSAALLETVPHGLDDNVLPPLFGTLVLVMGLGVAAGGPVVPLRALAVAAALNLAVAVAAWIVRLLEPAGVLAAWVLGTVTLGFGTWRAYLLLWLFLGIGTAVTRLRRAEKQRMGLEDEQRRGAGHVLANGSLCLLGSLLYGLSGGSSDLAAALIAGGLAAALSDTMASEIGKAYGRTAYALPGLRKVPPGTEGAVSIAGTMAGAVGAMIVAGTAVGTGLVPVTWGLPLALGGFLAMLFEGFLDRLGPASNHGTNLANTVMGALLAYAIHLILS